MYGFSSCDTTNYAHELYIGDNSLVNLHADSGPPADQHHTPAHYNPITAVVTSVAIASHYSLNIIIVNSNSDSAKTVLNRSSKDKYLGAIEIAAAFSGAEVPAVAR